MLTLPQIKKIMIREQIQHWMEVRGVSQTMLCRDLELSVQNFNAFMHGRRIVSINKLVVIMEYLRVMFAKDGNTYDYRPKDMSMFFLAITKGRGLCILELAENAGINGCSLSSFINGNRNLNYHSLDKLCDTLGVEMVTVGKS